MNTQSSRSLPVSPAFRAWLFLAAALLFGVGVRAAGAGAPPAGTPERKSFFAPLEPVIHFEPREVGAQLIQASSLIHAVEARQEFTVDGTGLTAAVLDTGVRTTHRAFPAGKIVEQRNFTDDNNGVDTDVSDGDGHGTNVAGIVTANGAPSQGYSGHTGIAPGAKLVPLKILDNNGNGDGLWLLSALQYLVANHSRLNITVANLSLGTNQNLQLPLTDTFSATVRGLITQLRNEKVAVVISAGNGFKSPANSIQGMAWPGIIPESVSVGAVYDAPFSGSYTYGSGAQAGPIVTDQICPFSQRLHPSINATTATDIFAPGAAITSAGAMTDQGVPSDTASSTMHGTSQAAPVTAGVILLMQQYHLRVTGQLPSVDDLESWLATGALEINDGDDESDNVVNTGLDYLRIDALGSLQAMEADLAGAYSISGRVTSNGIGVAAVSVTAGGKTVPTNAGGDYTIDGLEPGSYTVVPAKTNYVFTPTNRQVTITDSSLQNVDFTGVIPTYTITGTVRQGITPLAGVTVTGASQTVTTNAQGVYTLANVLPGTYTLTPTKANYTFEPASVQVPVTNANVTGVDFAATLVTYTLAGTIRYQGQGVEGVIVTLTGGAIATTNAQGEYSFAGLLAGSYTLSPTKAKTNFSPANRMVTVGPSLTGLDFVGTPDYQIRGTITRDGAPLPGVMVSIPGHATVTNAAGEYTLVNVEPGTYTVTPALPSHTFTPATRQVAITNDDQAGVDFTAELVTFTLSGRVTLNGTGLPGVTLTRTGGITATTDAEGNYSFSGVLAGTHLVTPSLLGYSFSPTAQSVIIHASNAVDVNFAATLIPYTISGFVRTKGQGVGGVRVSAGDRSTLSTSNGSYQITGLTQGTYTVTPYKLGCRFSPAGTEVTVGPSRTGIDFDSLAVPAISGKITLNKQGLAGATVTLTAASGTRTTTTSADGTYGFNDVTAGAYTLTPSLADHLFTPGLRRLRVAKKSLVNQNFTAAVLPDLVSLILTTSTVKGGRTTTATVTINGKAPAALKVTLLSGNPAVATVPATVTIPKGRTSARFTIRTKKVPSSTPVTLTATFDGVTRTADLTVTP